MYFFYKFQNDIQQVESRNLEKQTCTEINLNYRKKPVLQKRTCTERNLYRKKHVQKETCTERNCTERNMYPKKPEKQTCTETDLNRNQPVWFIFLFQRERYRVGAPHFNQCVSSVNIKKLHVTK
jgi:hypothetical protein